MVDFQSRDTRRGPVADDDDDEEETEAEPADEKGDGEEPTDEETAPEAGTAAGEGDVEGAAASTDDGEQTGQSQPDADPLAESEPAPSDDKTDAERVAGESAPATTDSEAEGRSDESSQTAGGDPLAEAEAEAEPTPGTGGAADPEPAPARADDEAAARQPVEPVRTIDVAVVTVGDGSEAAVVEAFESAGHTIATRERLQGDYDGLQRSVDTLVSRDDVDVVVTTGGIGISPDAVAIEAVHPLFEKALPGFGEAFRTLLYDVIGTGIVAVRSAAGVADGTLVFCLPADAEAAGLAVQEILVTEAPELVAHLEE